MQRHQLSDRKSARPAHRSARRGAARTPGGFLDSFDGRVLIAADSPGRREVLQEMLRAPHTGVTAVADWASFAGGEARLALTVAPDVGGLQLLSPRIAVLSESQLFGARASQERPAATLSLGSAGDPA